MPQASNHLFELTFTARFKRDPWNGELESPVNTVVNIRTLCLAPALDIAKRLAEECLSATLPSGDLFTGSYSELTYLGHTEIPISAMACLGHIGHVVISKETA